MDEMFFKRKLTFAEKLYVNQRELLASGNLSQAAYNANLAGIERMLLRARARRSDRHQLGQHTATAIAAPPPPPPAGGGSSGSSRRWSVPAVAGQFFANLVA